MCEGKREQGEGESKEEREAERVCGVCVCVRGSCDQWLDCTHSPCLHSSQKPPHVPWRSSARGFGEFSPLPGSKARLDSLSLRMQDQEAPQGPAPLVRT